VIGLISDTHGMVRASVFDALAGVELILHAGDVGGDDVLAELATIAPVLAVHGNTDWPGDPSLVPAIERTIGGVSIHVSHGHELGARRPRSCWRRMPRTWSSTGTRTDSSWCAPTGGWSSTRARLGRGASTWRRAWRA
jgi:putative phosphoesterase